MTKSTTAHSEYGRLVSLFVKKSIAAFISESHVDWYWKDLNYLGKPDLAKSVIEYEQFERLLKQEGTTIHYLPANDSVNMDSIYCRDASIATDKGMIICRMGKSGRANEPAAERDAFERNGIPILGVITSPGTLEGGDVAWLDQTTLAVGHTYRTNGEGIRQLKAFLNPIGVEVVVADLPHYKGPGDVFHLMSILSPVDKDLAVVYSPLMPVAFREYLLERGFTLVEVPEDEFESMGCNVLATAPRQCLMVSGNPKTKNLLEQNGCIVHEYDGNEISVKGGGGPTCLTRPILREL